MGSNVIGPMLYAESSEALAWLEIRTLTPDAFEEVEIAAWRTDGPGQSGPHGADLGSRVRAVDFRTLLDL